MLTNPSDAGRQTRMQGSMKVLQEIYVRMILNLFNVDGAKLVSTQLDAHFKLGIHLTEFFRGARGDVQSALCTGHWELDVCKRQGIVHMLE